MRRTRILATIGPASRDAATIRALVAAGADAFRLNYSHGTHDEHAAAAREIRAAAAEAGRPIAIVQDLGGPKIRTGEMAAPIQLVPGASLTIEHGSFTGDASRVSCAFDALFTSAHAGDRLLLDDGRLELLVDRAAPDRLDTRVVIGGELGAHKGINLPGVPIRTSAITPKDEDDLRHGIAIGADVIAVSFVQTADDVRRARAVAVAAGAGDVPIVAKIERPQAVESLDAIVEAADGLMVARGDLGIEMPLERVPAIQKRIILHARAAGVPVIVATEVLESMRHATRPTRAEVTDAAHAVDERADAIMLSGETAAGDYPVRTVETLAAIVREAEGALDETVTIAPPASGAWSAHALALGEAAVTLARRAQAAAIVAVTVAGRTARLLAAFRPPASIVAATTSAATAARLSLVWGVTPVLTAGTALPAVRDAIAARGLLAPGATVVFVSMQPELGRNRRNFLYVEKL